MGPWIRTAYGCEKEMNKDKIQALYHLAKQSGLFYNKVPIDPSDPTSSPYILDRCDYAKVYGEKKNNLPHDFYLGVKDRRIILVAHWYYELPLWITYPFPIERAPEIKFLANYQKSVELKGRPYTKSLNIKFRGSKVLTTEEVMQFDIGSVADFVIFNLDLFS